MYGLVRFLGVACRSDEVFYQYCEAWCVEHKLARRRARVNLARQNSNDQNLFLWRFNRKSLSKCEDVGHVLPIPTQIDRRRHTAAGLTGTHLMDNLPGVIDCVVIPTASYSLPPGRVRTQLTTSHLFRTVRFSAHAGIWPKPWVMA
jgi:hypothetical protein